MANIKFNNLEQIKKYLNEKTRKALEETFEEMENELKKIIIKDVYDAWDAEFYNTKRTYWLIREGVESYIKSLYGDKIAGGVRINTHKNYPVDLENYRHGNVYSGKFEPESFVEMLNNQANDGYAWDNPWHFPTLERKPFWDEFQEWANEHYKEIFEKKCADLGIDLKSMGGSTQPKKTVSNGYHTPGSANRGVGVGVGRANVYSSNSISGAFSAVNELENIFGI